MNTARTTVVDEAVERAIAFLEQAGDDVGSAWVRHVAKGEAVGPVLEALAAYQLPDGGFTRLEVDIKAPVSNPFAARLAMGLLVTLQPAGKDPSWLRRQPLVERLEGWLETAQDEDGDWHFAPEVYQHELAPWFAGWTFPSLNPAAGIAGLATRLGIGSAELHVRVRRLFDEKATLAEAESGEFYNVLPYFEYLHSVAHPARDAYLDALARNVERSVASGAYADAEHFFVHVDGGGSGVVGRLPSGIVEAQVQRLASEQQADGGWPTPYDPAWRPWSTAYSALILLRYGRGEAPTG